MNITQVIVSFTIKVPVTVQINVVVPYVYMAPTTATIAASLTTISASIAASHDTITATLTTMTSSITVQDNNVAVIDAKLVPSTAALSGGVYAIATTLPLMTAAIAGNSGSVGAIDTRLPVIDADISGYPGASANVAANLALLDSDITAVSGYVASIAATQKPIGVNITGMPGYGVSITAALPTITAALNAGFGATGTVTAGLPRIQSAISVLAQATTQQLVMVVGTHTNVVTTYEQYPFNSFFELGGLYYGAGPDGLCQIDTGDTDLGNFISAGIGTGLMNMGESHQKHIAAAYMTLRTAGDLTMTITVDEGADEPPVELTMTAQQFVDFIQRRIIIPKGLRGKSWQFELNNVDGCDFDFGQLGLTVALSTRRI